MKKQKRSLVEKNIFCFRVVLKHVGKDTTFIVRFNVLAGDKYEAQDILEEWLNEPSRTGYKFDRCVGITQCAEYSSGYIIVGETNNSAQDLIDRNELLKHKRYISLDRHEIDCVINVDKVLEAPSISSTNNIAENLLRDLAQMLTIVEGHHGLYTISEADLADIKEKYTVNIDGRDCTSCAFIEKDHREEPCCSCVDLSNWETKNER